MLDKPIILREQKVLLGEKEIHSYEDASLIKFHISPDGLKLLLLDNKEQKILIYYLQDPLKLGDIISTI